MKQYNTEVKQIKQMNLVNGCSFGRIKEILD